MAMRYALKRLQALLKSHVQCRKCFFYFNLTVFFLIFQIGGLHLETPKHFEQCMENLVNYDRNSSRQSRCCPDSHCNQRCA